MPRYELREGTSAKFWEIERDGSDVVTRWGRIGTDGQSKTKGFDSEDAAEAELAKMTRLKLKKGYKEVVAAEPGAVNDALEAQLLADPDDREAAAVYADWLTEQGDPRGELARLQLQGDEEGAAGFIEANKQALLGPLLAAAHETTGEVGWGDEARTQRALEIGWQFGWHRALRVCLPDYDAEANPLEILHEALAHPGSRFLQELTLGCFDFEGENFYKTALETISESPRPALKRLFVGDFIQEECEVSWSGAGGFGRLWEAAPNLESLTIHAGDIALTSLDAPKLRELVVESGGLSGSALQTIAAAELPELERLELWLGTEDYEGSTELAMLAPILAGKKLPKLKHLMLGNCDYQDEIARAVVGAAILPQLETLSLAMGTMIDGEGGEALLAGAGSFAHLERLDLSGNHLVETDRYLGLAKAVDVGGQKEFEEDWRYVSVGE